MHFIVDINICWSETGWASLYRLRGALGSAETLVAITLGAIVIVGWVLRSSREEDKNFQRCLALFPENWVQFISPTWTIIVHISKQICHIYPPQHLNSKGSFVDFSIFFPFNRQVAHIKMPKADAVDAFQGLRNELTNQISKDFRLTERRSKREVTAECPPNRAGCRGRGSRSCC